MSLLMICCNGLWSLTILNLRPYTYCQQWFTAQATASISRSRLQYLVSASIKLLDEKLTGLPSWSIHAPRPFWLASHSITISFCGSKYCNIVLSLTSAFSASSILVCVSSHTNSAFFFTRARRSCVLAARLGINFPRSGCPVPIFSYFFLFFEPIPIFSYFLTKTSYFSYFLAGEAKICNKIENGIIVVCVFEWNLS